MPDWGYKLMMDVRTGRRVGLHNLKGQLEWGQGHRTLGCIGKEVEYLFLG